MYKTKITKKSIIFFKIQNVREKLHRLKLYSIPRLMNSVGKRYILVIEHT